MLRRTRRYGHGRPVLREKKPHKPLKKKENILEITAGLAP
jgi:hypothetical protein